MEGKQKQSNTVNTGALNRASVGMENIWPLLKCTVAIDIDWVS